MHLSRARRRGVAILTALGLTASVGLVAASPASAAPQSDTFPLAMTSANENLGGYHVTAVDAVGNVWNIDIVGHGTWHGSLQTTVGWEADDVRQGQSLQVSRQVTSTSGSVDVSWDVSGTVSPFGLADIDLGGTTLNAADIPCVPKLSGSGYVCSGTSATFPLLPATPLPGSPYIDLKLVIELDVSPTGAIVDRSFQIGGDPAVPDASLGLDDSVQSETIPMPCTLAPGESVRYLLGPSTWAPGVTAKQRVDIELGVSAGPEPFPPFDIIKVPVWSGTLGTVNETTPTFSLTGGAHTVDMGALLKNNVLPKIDPIDPFTGGVEGSPVTFGATVHSQCPIGSYVWQFSDGTTSYGPSPKRAFGDDGTYDGQLTVTDITGLSATTSFTVDISNAAPVADAGPDTSGEWGVPLLFQGQATDPGWVDQPTLTYSWDWGDGTPATSGKNATHTYQVPSAVPYTATLTVCDDTTCVTDSAQVTVRKRETTTTYTGANTGTYSAPTTLAGTVVDEFGQPVSGASVAFTLGGASAGSASTNGSGVATRTQTVGLVAGSYLASAAYAGSAYYLPSASVDESYDVAKMATTIVYTGALTGGPNKTVNLSATLTDALGRPLPVGTAVTFKLGTQAPVTGSTDASGVAATTLKLTLKNGKYLLTATYAGDATHYAGSVASATFSLQSK